MQRDPLPRPYVLKPVNEGSSVGVAIVTDRQLWQPDRRDVGPWQEFDTLLAEPFIKGRELTVAVLADKALMRHRTQAQKRLLRFRCQIYRRH
jgi:D-alanine-D-alanine ligase